MRRILLSLALAALCGPFTGRASAPPAAAATVAPEAVPDVFPAIPEVRALHGVARVALDVIVDPVTGYPAFAWGTKLGEAPTIRVQPGDTIDMTVRNAMKPFDGRRDDINVHFHGLTVSPNAPGDDALMTLARPGQTLHYVVRIPRDHEPGLYWYHPHAHGESYYDVTNGMAGAIVVEGIQRHLPTLAAMRERVIVLRDVPTGPGFVDDDMPTSGTVATASRPRGLQRGGTGKPCRAEPGLQPTLNRQADAHIGIRPGESQFFRVVNASAARYFDLSVDGAPLVLVARDGVPLDAYPGTPPSRTVSHVLLPPAARAEFVVTAPRGATVLRSACVDTGATGDADPAVVLAHLADPAAAGGAGRAPAGGASGPANDGTTASVGGGSAYGRAGLVGGDDADLVRADALLRAGSSLRVGAALPANLLSQPLPAPAARRTIRFSEDDRGFYIDGAAFAMDAPPAIVARSGTVEEWTIENVTDEVHDFHIHQVHFVTESVDGVAVAPHLRAWSDTVDVPPRRRVRGAPAVPGRVRLLVDFRDPVVRGTFVFHCHILDHEDQGMMAAIRVR